MDGVINVLKPAGMTSFDVVARLRRIYGQKKIGHGGTLDPLAAGVLPVFLGRATRLIEYAPIRRKTYEAEFLMGMETDTEDVSGTVTGEGPLLEDQGRWEEGAAAFTGDIMQVPSSYSSVLIKGRRAYDLAREGKEVSLPARPIHIFRLTIREVKAPYLRLSVDCSSGTYVRALGRDLGRAAGSPLTMAFLLRSKAGPFDVEEAHTLEEIEADPERAVMTDMRSILTDLPEAALTEKEGADFLTGKKISSSLPEAKAAAVYEGSRFLGIGEIRDGLIHPRKVFG